MLRYLLPFMAGANATAFGMAGLFFPAILDPLRRPAVPGLRGRVLVAYAAKLHGPGRYARRTVELDLFVSGHRLSAHHHRRARQEPAARQPLVLRSRWNASHGRPPDSQ